MSHTARAETSSFSPVPLLTSSDEPDADSTRTRSINDLYRLLPLPLSTSTIRLLDLERLGDRADCSDGDLLDANLRVVSLDEHPKFTALSYVWGGYATPRDTIRCNGCDIVITRNCRDALRALTKRCGSLTIWIDAICINQDDVDEKNDQIPRMEDIYPLANLVYVWLGQSSPESRRALRCLEQISSARVCVATESWINSSPRRERDLRIFTTCLKEGARMFPWSQYARFTAAQYFKENYVAQDLEEVLSREWFSRIWTLQELILARRVLLVCGEEAIGWKEFICRLSFIQQPDRMGDVSDEAMKNFDDPPTGTDLPNTRVDEPASLQCWIALCSLWMHARRKTDTAGQSGRQHLETRESIGESQASVAKFLNTCYSLHNWASYFGMASASLIHIAASTLPSLSLYSCGLPLQVFLCMIVCGMIFTALIDVVLPSPRLQVVTLDYSGSNSFKELDEDSGLLPPFVQSVIQALKFRRAVNPRDKVYAVDGILRSLDAPALDINYRKTQAQVYQEFYTTLLQWKKSFLCLLVEVGGPGVDGMSSWVPDWESAEQRSWLPLSIYDDVTQLERGAAFVSVSGRNLKVRGQVMGPVSFCSGPLAHLQDNDTDTQAHDSHDFLESTARLCHWIDHARHNAPPTPPYQSMLRAIYDVLNATRYKESESVDTHYPAIYRVVLNHIGRIKNESNYYTTAALVLADLTKDPAERRYLSSLLNSLAGKRNLFAMASGELGSGPPEMVEGDLVTFIAGLPVPMILRASLNTMDETFTVVGPALVHGLVDKQKFQTDMFYELTLV